MVTNRGLVMGEKKAITIFAYNYGEGNGTPLQYPLISLGPVPHHHLALSVKELTYSSNS